MSTTIETHERSSGFAPEPLSSRIFVRCYRSYGDAKRARDQLNVVAGIPERRMTVVARGLEWRESIPLGTLYRVCCSGAAMMGALVGFALWALGFAAADVDLITQLVLAGVVGLAIGFVGATVVARVRGRSRGLVETGHVEPRQYDILVEEEFALKARELLGTD